MENLTKHQIILLTLLVSFVTSIATGIVTVALMNQAPVGITQTIDRVVEKTIEQVTTPSTNTPGVKETVVVSEDDQVVSTINKNENSVLRIYRVDTDPTTGTTTAVFTALGAVVSDDGIIATDNNVIAADGHYFVKTSDGTNHDLAVLEAANNEQIALLQLKADDKNPVTGLSKIALSDQDIKLGQAVVYIGGQTKNIVATGIVSSLNTKDIIVTASSTDANATSTVSTSTQTIINSVETNVPTDNFIEGGLLFNLSGELVGIKSTYTDSSKTNLFAPTDDVTTAISDYTASQTKTQ
jgi:S1-C subfamily serine protease